MLSPQDNATPHEIQQHMLSQWIMSQTAFKETISADQSPNTGLSAEDVSAILALRQKITQAQGLP